MKYYWTTEGFYARVYEVTKEQIHGAVYELGSWVICAWTHVGTEWRVLNQPYPYGDLILSGEAPLVGAWRPANIDTDQSPMVARFRPDTTFYWTVRTLVGYRFDDGIFTYLDDLHCDWNICEVYDDTIVPERKAV